jgi:hypothetical protein
MTYCAAVSTPRLALFAPPRSVAIVAALVTVAILLLCFLVPRSPGMEEAGVFNAVYTYAYAGRIAFPVYGRDFFESFGIQPPPHFAILGYLIRHGFSLYTAEGVAIAASAVTAIVLIVRSMLPTPVKLGFLLGLYGTTVLAVMYLPDDAIGVRPELNVSLIWFAGLVALESGRLDGWRRGPLALGTMLVTLAATMQNYALLAPVGLIPYAVWMTRTVPARETIRTIAWCVAAGCVVGIPFLLWHVYPNWQMMQVNINWGTTHAPAAGAKIAAYFSIYDYSFAPRLRADLWSASFAAAPMFWGLLLRVPLIIPAFVLLFAQRSTRGMALACLPVPVLITWIRPEAQYYISEHIIFLAAFWATALRGLHVAAVKLAPHRRVLREAVAAVICCAAVVLGSPPLRAIRLSDGIPLHEFDIARASARQIVGTNALVASRHLAWYLSGGASWYRLESDLTEPATLDGFDARAYAAQFDAIADYGLFSAQTQNGTTPSSLYATGALELKGFYLAQRMAGLSFLLFQQEKRGAVHGYVLRDDRLQRFDEDPEGSSVFVMLYGPATPPFRRMPVGGVYSPNVLDVPGDPAVRALSALILPRQTYAQELAQLPIGFERRDEVFGTLSAVDARDLVAASRATDRPIRFLRTPQEGGALSQ